MCSIQRIQGVGGQLKVAGRRVEGSDVQHSEDEGVVGPPNINLQWLAQCILSFCSASSVRCISCICNASHWILELQEVGQFPYLATRGLTSLKLYIQRFKNGSSIILVVVPPEDMEGFKYVASAICHSFWIQHKVQNLAFANVISK